MLLTLTSAVVVLAFSGGSTARAAMAPRSERWAEPRAVLGEDAVADRLAAHGAVERIEVMPKGAYRVWAGQYYLDVAIRRRASRTPGGDAIVGVTPSDVRCSDTGDHR